MKRIVCMLLSAVMVLSISSVALAADDKTVDITKTVTQEYTWTIPSAAITAGGSGGAVQVTKNVIPSGKSLKISMTAKNDASSKHYLVDVSDSANKIEYTLTPGTGVILTVASGTNTGSVTVSAAVSGTVTKAGTYKDTLTFTSSVV